MEVNGKTVPDFGYATFSEVVAAAEAAGASISDVVLAQQAAAMEVSCDELFEQMAGRLRVMDEGVEPGCAAELRSTSGLTGGDAHRMREAARSGGSLLGRVMDGALYRALAVSELNAAMGRIVAAPTAGSCGILPAAVLTMRDERGCDERACVMSLFTAAAVGLVIERNASLAGAEGGCQAESAASTAIQNLLGLVCDPVAGLVEVPCVKRNASGVAVALVAAELALAGCGNVIPADEAIAAMRRVGVGMPPALRETAEGGLAVTPTGLSLAERVFGRPADGGAARAGTTGAPGARGCGACRACR